VVRRQFFKVTGDFEKGVKNWQRIASEGIEEDILAAAEETAQHLLAKIQEDSLEAGPDWYQAALQGQVVKTGSDVHLFFPEETFDLEYGNPEKGLSPRRLVLANANQMRRENTKRFSNLLSQRWGWGSAPAEEVG
jgi:hypothetical protein